MGMASPSRHSGFAALVGAPNVGKSTLLNRLAGAKLSIASPKPQTTRARILGVVSRAEGQVAFVDTPGLHPAKRGLNRHLVQIALHAMADADLVLLMVEAPAHPSRRIPELDRFVVERLAAEKKRAFLLINKIDRTAKPDLLGVIDTYRRQLEFVEVVPISATRGDGVDELLALVLSCLPEGEPMFDEDMLTDQAERALAAEYIREQLLRHCRDEIPYSAAVTVGAFDESERMQPRAEAGNQLAGLVRIDATIHLERESQRGIVIGKGGRMLKTVGAAARVEIEQLLGARVYLALHVRVEPRWSERPEALRKLGYE
jgi:GTP-binding protein Era